MPASQQLVAPDVCAEQLMVERNGGIVQRQRHQPPGDRSAISCDGAAHQVADR
jgi:hypothetical protein